MTTNPTPLIHPLSNRELHDHEHQHGVSCWWDHQQARLICQPTATAAQPAGQPASDHPAPAAAIPAVEPPLVDVRDMIVVHTAMLREFRLSPDAVGRVPAGNTRAARRVDAHLQLLCDLLHHHHSGEDELLWPPLRAVLPPAGQALLDDAEAQHAGIDQALDQVNTARARWIADAAESAAADLVAALHRLHQLLAEHLDTEERTLLPLAAAHLTPAQWAAVGAAGAASVPKAKMLLVLGMFAYEGDPQVLAEMLRPAPPPVRILVPLAAPRVYARHAARIYGTRRP